jgi:RNA polymerase sigma-70 factor (ECF subfamily)
MITADPLHVAAAQAGDERAFRTLVEPYRRALEVHCYRMLGSVHDAEDISQEVLLRAWRSLEGFQRRASIETWLYRIATNACLDELERRPRRAEPVEPYPDERLEDAMTSIADPAARYARREGMELALLTAIQRLPGRQRAVLILRDVLGWTGSETADLLDTTVTAVNSALQRARATIETEAPARAVAPGRRTQRELLRRYVDAWERADMPALVDLLREDAVMTMPPQPALAGRETIVAFFASNCVSSLHLSAAASWVNGTPAVELRTPAGELHRLLVLDVIDGRITHIGAYRLP